MTDANVPPENGLFYASRFHISRLHAPITQEVNYFHNETRAVIPNFPGFQ